MRSAWDDYEAAKTEAWQPPRWQQVAAQAVGEHKAMQDPVELAALLSILHDQVGPATILEIGTGAGGSSYAWAQLPDVTRIVSVDIVQPGAWSWKCRAEVHHQLVTASSHTLAGFQLVTRALDGHPADMVFIDGDHTGGVPLKDAEMYGPLVPPGGVVVFHDTKGPEGRSNWDVGNAFLTWAVNRPSLALLGREAGPFGTGIVWM